MFDFIHNAKNIENVMFFVNNNDFAAKKKRCCKLQ